MPSYFVNNGVKQEMTDDMFDLLWDNLGKLDITDSEASSYSEEVEKPLNSEWRKQENGYYNSKPIDKNYFKKYYEHKTHISCVCDVCGKELSCKSNLAKHKKTKRCKSLNI